MIEYLQSSEFSGREDAADTVSSVPILQKVIKGGMITENSQEGSCLRGFNEDSGRYYEIQERAYLTGFMKRENARKFVDLLNTETDKIAFIIQSEPNQEFDKLFYEGDPKAISSIPVTVGNSAKRKSDIKTLYPNTRLYLVMPTNTINNIKKGVHLNKAEAVELVACIDPVYCRKAASAKGLYKDVLKVLEKLS